MGFNSFIPAKDQDLRGFLVNLHTTLAAGPGFYGITAGEVTTLGGLTQAFVANLDALDDPDTDTSITVAMKNSSRAEAVAAARLIVRKIRANPAVSPAMLEAIRVRPIAPRVPVSAPDTTVIVTVLSSLNRLVRARFRDISTPDRRRKPAGTVGALVYSYVVAAGEQPPQDLEQWRCEGLASRDTFDVDFDAADTGKTAYIVAVWVTATGLTGPIGAPAVTTVAA